MLRTVVLQCHVLQFVSTRFRVLQDEGVLEVARGPLIVRKHRPKEVFIDSSSQHTHLRDNDLMPKHNVNCYLVIRR